MATVALTSVTITDSGSAVATPSIINHVTIYYNRCIIFTLYIYTHLMYRHCNETIFIILRFIRSFFFETFIRYAILRLYTSYSLIRLEENILFCLFK